MKRIICFLFHRGLQIWKITGWAGEYTDLTCKCGVEWWVDKKGKIGFQKQWDSKTL